MLARRFFKAAAAAAVSTPGCVISSSRRTRLYCTGHASQGGLTHVDGAGRASMVDVGDKSETVRTAIASARVLLGKAAFDLVGRWVQAQPY